MLKQIGKSIWPTQKRKGWSAFDFEITQSDLATFPTSKVVEHGIWDWQVGYDAIMWLNYLHNIWSHNGLLKLLAWTLTDASRCFIKFYFANAVSSGGVWTLRGNYHTPTMNKTDWKFRGYKRNDIRYYNYVDQTDSPSVMFSGLSINTLYEMEVWKEWASVKMRMRTLDGDRSWIFALSTAAGSSPSQYYCLHAWKGGGSIANYRYTHVAIALNA